MVFAFELSPIWNFTRNIQVNEANVLVTASSTGSPVEGSAYKKRAGFCLYLGGPNMDVDPAEDGNGLIVLCHGNDAVEALKEAVSHAIAALMEQIPGWERTRERGTIPIYGRQRLYRRCA